MMALVSMIRMAVLLPVPKTWIQAFRSVTPHQAMPTMATVSSESKANAFEDSGTLKTMTQ